MVNNECVLYIFRYRVKNPKINPFTRLYESAEKANKKPCYNSFHSAITHAFPIGTSDDEIVAWFDAEFKKKINTQIEQEEKRLRYLKGLLKMDIVMGKTIEEGNEDV